MNYMKQIAEMLGVELGKNLEYKTMEKVFFLFEFQRTMYFLLTKMDFLKETKTTLAT